MSKMAAVRAILSENPHVTPAEIVTILRKQKITISEGVASNYKSVIKRSNRRKKRKAAPVLEAVPAAAQKTDAGIAVGNGLDPALVEILKAGKALGWKQVRSIADFMSA